MFSIEGQGTPLVVLPGFGLDRSVMSAAFEPVFGGPKASNNWKRIYLDLPGCGETPAVEPTSDAVLDAIQESVTVLLGGGPFLLAGLSYGGYLAAGLARRLPEQVRGLLLVCPGVKIDPERRNLAGAEPSTPEPRWLDDVSDDLREYFERAIGRQTRAVGSRMTQVFEDIGPMDEDYLELLRATGYELSDEDSRQIYDGEVALMVGRRDRVAGHLDQLAALANYSHGTFDLFPDAGHYLPFERPESFAVRTLEWLVRCEPAMGRGAGRRTAWQPEPATRPEPVKAEPAWKVKPARQPAQPPEPALRPEPVLQPAPQPEPAWSNEPAEPARRPEPARRLEPAWRAESADEAESDDEAPPEKPEPPATGPRPTLRIIH